MASKTKTKATVVRINPPRAFSLSRARALCVCACMCPCVRVHMCGRIAISHTTLTPPNHHTFPALHTARNPPPSPTPPHLQKIRHAIFANKEVMLAKALVIVAIARLLHVRRRPTRCGCTLSVIVFILLCREKTQKKESPHYEPSEWAVLRAVKRA